METAKNKIVLVTGGSRGIGRSIVLAFARSGYHVAINFLASEKAAESVALEAQKFGIQALTVQANVSDSKQVNEMMATIRQKWGQLDVLINNAGLSRDRTILKMSDEDWNSVLSSNLTGPFYTTRAALTYMIEQKSGCILNIASYLATRPVRGASNYSASKAGLIAFTKSTALEGGSANVRANAILPGFHVTDMNRSIWQKWEQSIRDQHMLKALPETDSLANFVVQISEMTTVTGQVFSFESRLC